jgi:hypothetical protein
MHMFRRGALLCCVLMLTSCRHMCRLLLPAACRRVVVVVLSQSRGRWDLSPVEGGPRPIKLTVRRDALLEDAYRGLAGLGQGLKGRLMVRGLVGRALDCDVTNIHTPGMPTTQAASLRIE